mmetsp:Transcript_1984/g.2647  ORF Transcript_1984/g.2647 Transcript_1984/m.2647 type:complete len:91 (+) Transcript_1984:49-321(+)
MSEEDDSDNEDYEYEYSDGDDDNNEDQDDDDDESTSKISRCTYPSDVKRCQRMKYLEADLSTLNMWAQNCPIRLTIVSSIRQIVDHPSDR